VPSHFWLAAFTAETLAQAMNRCRTLLLALAVSSLAAALPAAMAQNAEPGDPKSAAAPVAAPEQGHGNDAEPDAAPPAEALPETGPAPAPATRQSICLLLESAAQAHRLPFEFFARLIWQESRFRPDAVGPITRSGRRALGISQFMPGTASERGLLDPFDPVAALPKSAEFLEELRREFGNLGLAAAAYNAGPRRVRDWLDGRGFMPAQTRGYVLTITGRTVDEWAAAGNGGDSEAAANRLSCEELMAALKAPPSSFMGELARRVQDGSERPWGVELSAGFVRERVLAAYAGVEKTYRTLLENRDPIIIERTFRSRGTHTFYQARIGTDTRAGADQLCTALRRAGGACLVLRNQMTAYGQARTAGSGGRAAPPAHP
jgi:hypothetical protein